MRNNERNSIFVLQRLLPRTSVILTIVFLLLVPAITTTAEDKSEQQKISLKAWGVPLPGRNDFRSPLGRSGLPRPPKQIKHLPRQLTGDAPAVIAKKLLIPVGMLAKTGSWKLPIINPAVVANCQNQT